MLPDEMPSEVAERHCHHMQPGQHFVDRCAHVGVPLDLENFSNEKPVNDLIAKLEVPIQWLAAQRAGRNILRPPFHNLP
jgi:hypothetical protein